MHHTGTHRHDLMLYLRAKRREYGGQVVAGYQARYRPRPCSSIQGIPIVWDASVGVQPMKRAYLLVVACAIIPTMAATGYGIFAVWPFHDLIGKALAVLIVVLIGCAIALALNFTWRKITSPEVISEGPYMLILTKTGYIHASAEHVRAGVVPQVTVKELPPPSGELSAEDKDIIDRSKVLTAHFDEGKGMHAIEKELGIPYNKVRDWCNTAESLRAQQKSW